MFLVGLTGGIASGKSTVVSILRELGCAVIDADLIARQVVRLGTPAYSQIVQHFGDGVLLVSGELDREKLGAIIFSDPEKRCIINSITHPQIRREMLRQTLWYFFLEMNITQNDLKSMDGRFRDCSWLGPITHGAVYLFLQYKVKRNSR
ncbi:hypothetical protein XENTR_v10003821 [Xenopus tropicalis]|nr:hypothetical protein XENTR_v10003821 [Xenopus tropicalis]